MPRLCYFFYSKKSKVWRPLSISRRRNREMGSGRSATRAEGSWRFEGFR